MERGRRRAAARFAVAVAAITAVLVVHARMDTRSALAAGQRFVPRPAEAKLSSLGFDALVADFWWLQAVQIVGGALYSANGAGMLLGKLIDVVTTLDPWVGHPYRFAAVWLIESREEVLLANRLLERAVAYHPRDWRNRHYLGFNHFYYLDDQARAADILEPAVTLPKAPRYLGSLVAKLRTDRDGLETAAAFLTQLAAETDDEYSRAEYLKSLDEVQTERMARLLDEARRRYRERNGRDIGRVEDLLRGPAPVLRALPPAHPLFPGFVWELDPETGVIQSSFYRARYAPHGHERRTHWLRENAVEGGA